MTLKCCVAGSKGMNFVFDGIGYDLLILLEVSLETDLTLSQFESITLSEKEFVIALN